MSIDPHFTKPEARAAFAVAGHLIACYHSSRAGLKQLGLLRTERTLQGDFAEWIAAQLLDLQLSTSTIEKHVDATDSAGRTYQIKSRIVTTLSQNTSFDFRSSELSFDFLIAVFLDPGFRVLAVLRIPREVVASRVRETSTDARFRWNRACADDPRIERVYWQDAPSTVAASTSD